MANYIVSDTNLTAVANAIRTKGGTSEQLEFPDDFVSAIGDIQTGGGGTDTLAELESNTLTSWTSTATKVGLYLFYQKNALTSVSYPNATTTGQYAFANCTGLKTVSLPSLTTVGQAAFTSCTGLKTVSLPSLTTIGVDTFTYCTGLKTVSLPSVTAFASSAFFGCSSLESITINPAFAGTGQSALFRNCSSLTVFDWKNGSSISSNQFNGCTKLATLILRKTNDICTLANTNAFSGTPFASDGTGGTLYVPQDLIASYQSASKWSTILGYPNNQIKAIEGSIYE